MLQKVLRNCHRFGGDFGNTRVHSDSIGNSIRVNYRRILEYARFCVLQMTLVQLSLRYKKTNVVYRTHVWYAAAQWSYILGERGTRRRRRNESPQFTGIDYYRGFFFVARTIPLIVCNWIRNCIRFSRVREDNNNCEQIIIIAMVR